MTHHDAAMKPIEERSLTRRNLLRWTAGAAGGVAATASVGRAYATPSTRGPYLHLRNQDAGELVIYNWYQPWIAEVAPMFEEETGITVTQLGTYSSNQEWWAKLNAGEEFDFFIPTTDWVQRAVAAELMTPLDLEQIPNAANIMADYQEVEYYRRDDDVYAIPFFRLNYSLTYNTETFPEAPTSWGVTWNEEYEGQITLQDQAFARVGITALLLDDDPLNPTKWDEITEMLREQRPLVQKYWVDYQNGMELFVNEEVVVGQLTDGRTRNAQDVGAPVNWTVPEEGALVFIDTFGIPKTSKNPENAHTFIDFLLRPDISLLEMRGMRYDTLNQAAYDELSEEERTAFATPEGANLILVPDLTAEVRTRIDETWNEVKLA
ncbi:MAG: ABC transporter substrate-binding protein [Thermomicrobiales bacterium]